MNFVFHHCVYFLVRKNSNFSGLYSFKLFFLIYLFLKYPKQQGDIEMKYLNKEEAVKRLKILDLLKK